MSSTGIENAGEDVSTKRLFVLQTAPDHPLSAPDPHLTLKLRKAQLQHDSDEDAEEHEDAQSF
jgi:hypothetical protein